MGQRIRVQIAGRFYPITVSEGEEEVVRTASKNIQDLIDSIESKYSISDKQDALAMAAIQYATKFEIQKKIVNNINNSSKNNIENLKKQIKESLKDS